MIEPIRVTEVSNPVAITNPRPGIFMVDFGQAFYGSVGLKVSGPAGTEVRIHTSFNVTPDGLLNVANDRAPTTSTSTRSRARASRPGNRGSRPMPRVTPRLKAFRARPPLDNFEGLVTHTDMEPVGQFTCSNPLINRIYQNGRWGTRMQNRSVPMEPDRDERMPWSGHPAKTSESEGYAFNVARFYDHFLHNYRAHQGDDGSLQEILPPYWTFNSKDIIWPSIITVIPDWYYNFYGDLRPLADNFECMKRWVLFHQKAYQKPDFTIDYCNYGDWVDGSWIKGTTDKRTTSRPLDVDGVLLQQLPDRRPGRELTGKDRRCQAIRRTRRPGQGGLQRTVLQPQDEQIRERDPGIVRLPPGLWPGARGTPGRGRSRISLTRSWSSTRAIRQWDWWGCNGSCKC